MTNDELVKLASALELNGLQYKAEVERLRKWVDMIAYELNLHEGDREGLANIAALMPSISARLGEEPSVRAGPRPRRHPDDLPFVDDPRIVVRKRMAIGKLKGGGVFEVWQELLAKLDAAGVWLQPPRMSATEVAYVAEVEVNIGRVLGLFLLTASKEEKTKALRELGAALRPFAPDVADYLESYGS